jgi:AcrR family transcriptional regulator
VSLAPACAGRVGRPRDPATDRAILAAALELLRERGYQHMSIEAVAAAAGVGKPTIYRRFPSKAALVVAAIASLQPVQIGALPASTREAVELLMRGTAGALADPGGMAVLGTLLAERQREPELAEALRAQVFRPAIDRVRDILRAGQARGEVRQDIDPQAVIDMLFGSLLARAALGEPADPRWLSGVVDACWRGIGLAR